MLVPHAGDSEGPQGATLGFECPLPVPKVNQKVDQSKSSVERHATKQSRFSASGQTSPHDAQFTPFNPAVPDSSSTTVNSTGRCVSLGRFWLAERFVGHEVCFFVRRPLGDVPLFYPWPLNTLISFSRRSFVHCFRLSRFLFLRTCKRCVCCIFGWCTAYLNITLYELSEDARQGEALERRYKFSPSLFAR